MTINEVRYFASMASEKISSLHCQGQEATNAHYATSLIYSFSRIIERIDNAIDLYEMARDRRIKGVIALHAQSTWTQTAIRDIVISIEDFFKLITDAKTLLDRCPTIRAVVSITEIDKARDRFQRLFPDHLDMRNAAAHIVDYSSRPERTLKNADVIMATETVINGHAVYTGDGKTMALLLDKSITQNLIAVALQFLAPFQSL